LITSKLRGATDEKDVQIGGVQPLYDVPYRIGYSTTGAQSQPVQASGLVSVPVKAHGDKSPVLPYQHGTIFCDARVPSNKAMPAAAAVVDFLAAAPTRRQAQGVASSLWPGSAKEATPPWRRTACCRPATHCSCRTCRPWPRAPVRTTCQPLWMAWCATTTGWEVLWPIRRVLRYLGSAARNTLRKLVPTQLLPEDAGVEIGVGFRDPCLADGVQAIARHSSVHDCKPEVPLFLYQGRNNRTVPSANSVSALHALRARRTCGHPDRLPGHTVHPPWVAYHRS